MFLECRESTERVDSRRSRRLKAGIPRRNNLSPFIPPVGHMFAYHNTTGSWPYVRVQSRYIRPPSAKGTAIGLIHSGNQSPRPAAVEEYHGLLAQYHCISWPRCCGYSSGRRLEVCVLASRTFASRSIASASRWQSPRYSKDITLANLSGPQQTVWYVKLLCYRFQRSEPLDFP